MNETPIDPELVALRKPYLGPRPLSSLSIILFCGYLLVILWPDLRFSRQSAVPTKVSEAAQLVGKKAETYVQLHAVPDHSYAVRIRASAAEDGVRLRPTQGTQDKVWILSKGSSWRRNIPKGYFQGRTRLLADLPFSQELAEHGERRADSSRTVSASQLRATLEKNLQVLRTPTGDTVPISAATPVFLTVLDPTRVQILVQKHQFSPTQWNQKLIEADILGEEDSYKTEQLDWLLYEVDAPQGATSINAKLDAARLFGPRATAVEREFEAKWSQLTATKSALVINHTPEQRIRWRTISFATVTVPRPIPQQAVVVIDGEHPSEFRYIFPLFVLLVVLLGVFVWALIRSIVHDSNPRVVSDDAASHL